MKGNRYWLALVAVGVMLATACSTGGSQSSDANSEINLGLLGTFTGARSNVGAGMLLGTQLAIAQINAKGGILGTHKIKLSQQDDAFDPGDAVPAAQKLLETDNVVAIVGPTSATASVVLPLASKKNVPMLMFGGGSAFDNVTDPHFWRMSASDTEQADAMAYYAHTKGWDKVAIALGNADVDQALLPGLQYATKKLGMTVTTTQNFISGATNFRSELSNLFSGHPQAILAQVDINSAPTLFAEVTQEGLRGTPWVASNSWDDPAFFKTVGAAVASSPDLVLANPGASGTAGLAPFTTLWTAANPTLRPAITDMTMYDAVTTWALGAAEAGTWTEPQITNGILKATAEGGTVCGDYASCYDLIKAGKSIDWEGAFSNCDFDKYHNVFGPFDILHYNADGTLSTLTTLQAPDILGSVNS